MSKARLGKTSYWKGKKMSKVIKEKMRLAHLGFRHTEKSKIKMSESNKGNKSHHWGKHRSEKVRRKMSKSHRGKKSYNWKGGQAINKVIRASLEYRLWREAVFKRDNWTCKWCRVRSRAGKIVILNADHIKQFAYFPKLRFAIDNGRTLCIDCHKKTNTYGNVKI